MAATKILEELSWQFSIMQGEVFKVPLFFNSPKQNKKQQILKFEKLELDQMFGSFAWKMAQIIYQLWK